jgi:hypothetical protein
VFEMVVVGSVVDADTSCVSRVKRIRTFGHYSQYQCEDFLVCNVSSSKVFVLFGEASDQVMLEHA